MSWRLSAMSGVKFVPCGRAFSTGTRLAFGGSDVVLMKQCNPVNIKTMSDRLGAYRRRAAFPDFALSFEIPKASSGKPHSQSISHMSGTRNAKREP